MNKLLVVCGPTATGKTSAALQLASKINAEVVSADSRQVYKGLNIGTGKDLPSNAKYLKDKSTGYYLIEGIRLWGYDLVSPKKEYSVAEYAPLATEIINNIWKKDKTAILVGGTGLYIKSVVDGIDTIRIPKNPALRENLDILDVSELFEKLALLDSVKAASLNASDRKNPRRLIRAIEIAQWHVTFKGRENNKKGLGEKDELFVGLKADKMYLDMLVEKRVDERMKKGMVKEIKKLLDKGITWNMQSMNAMGYKQMKSYFEDEENLVKVVDKWKVEEKRYIKRQLTWFTKDKRIRWFDIQGKDYPENMEKYVLKWYKE